MATFNPQAEALNEKLQQVFPSAYALLSEEGKGAFFPKRGILAQTADAKGKKFNATIGVAYEEDGSFMGLSSVNELINVPPQSVLGYAPSPGIQTLREMWQQMIQKKNPSANVASLPVATTGLTHALSTVARLFGNADDEIISPDFFWGNYKLIFSGFVPGEKPAITTFETFKDGGFNLDGLKEHVMGEGDKKIVILNFPNNPTGYSPTNEETEAIVSMLIEAAEAGKKIVVICDDAYFGLVYEEGVFEESLFAPLSNAHENIIAVKVDGATKEDYVWGFRLGFISFAAKGMEKEAHDILAEKATGIIRSRISNSSHLVQEVMLQVFNADSYERDKQEKYAILRSRYEKVKEVLGGHPEYAEYFEAVPYNSGYFMCVALKQNDAEEVRQKLLSDYDTGVIAVRHLIRVAYASLPLEQIDDLFVNLFNACKELAQS